MPNAKTAANSREVGSPHSTIASSNGNTSGTRIERLTGNALAPGLTHDQSVSILRKVISEARGEENAVSAEEISEMLKGASGPRIVASNSYTPAYITQALLNLGAELEDLYKCERLVNSMLRSQQAASSNSIG